MSQPSIRLNSNYYSNNNQITFDNAIKKPNFDKVIRVNKNKLFSYDETKLFGQRPGALRPSAFSQLVPELMQNRKLPLIQQTKVADVNKLQVGIAPSQIWKYQNELKDNVIDLANENNKQNFKYFDPNYEISHDQYQRMPTVNKLQLFETVSDNKYFKEETSEKQVVLSSDNYFGTINCILHCLMKVLPLQKILKQFLMGQIQRNDYSNFEGVIVEQLATFFQQYKEAQKKKCISPVKVMRLIELMNSQYKSFFKRDPFEMLIQLLHGLHQDINSAPLRNQINTSYPGFETQGLVELDYIQAEKWEQFYKQRDDSPIYDMFQGKMLKYIQCQSCFNPKLIFEKFISITLNLQDYPKGETINLQELLVEYFQKIQNAEGGVGKIQVQGEQEINQFYCLKCRKNTPYKKEVSVWTFPKFLIIQIQRFESYVNKVNSYQHNVYFPVNSLDLRKFAKVSKDDSIKLAVYNLIGCTQLAGFLNANRFSATVLNQFEKRWYQYEEEEHVNQQGVESPSKQAYILFYQRIDALSHSYI